MPQLSNPRLAQQWRERIERFDQSELTIVAFCRLEGCSAASFYHYGRRLGTAKNDETLPPPSLSPFRLANGDYVLDFNAVTATWACGVISATSSPFATTGNECPRSHSVASIVYDQTEL